MNIEDLREYCLSINGASECFPFDEDTLVFKIMNKMFAYASLTPRNGDFFVNLKSDPQKALELRSTYEGVIPGYHANKKYWNSVYIDSDVPDQLIQIMIKQSVEEVLKKLPQKKQIDYNNGNYE